MSPEVANAKAKEAGWWDWMKKAVVLDGPESSGDGRMADAVYQYLIGFRDVNIGIYEPFGMDTRLIFLCEDDCDKRAAHVNRFGRDGRDGPIDGALCGLVTSYDATIYGPADGYKDLVLWHPPYLGSAPMSDVPGELSRMDDDEYYKALWRATVICYGAMQCCGIVGIVGRQYMYRGKSINLGMMMAGMFLSLPGMKIVQMALSTPDVVVVCEKSG